METLKTQIENFNTELAKQLPPEVLEAFGKSIEDLKTKNIEENSIKVGDSFPAFSIPNAKNEIVNSSEILKNGKMIIAFYRGAWCPYCNLELAALQNVLPEIESKKATLVAISPQSPDNSLTTVEKNSLTFEVLTDDNNVLASKIGISFKLQDFIVPVYEAVGIDVPKHNGNNDNTLPVPAVYVIGQNGIVESKYIDSNYMNRVNIEQLLTEL
jgi:peroxiredoxin